MDKSLTILIPTLSERGAQLCTLLRHIYAQVGDRRISIYTDPRGRAITIGKKRTEMLWAVNSDYICFVDDDDMVSHDYIEKVYDAIQSGPDVVGMRGYVTLDRSLPLNWIISTKYTEWAGDVDGFKYVRYPNHLSPIKLEHARAVGFPDVRHAEDYEYSMGLKKSGLLKTQTFIDSEIYFYHFISRK